MGIHTAIAGWWPKCFDKLWLKDCLVELWRAGMREREVYMLYEMNKESNIAIENR